MGQLLIKSKKKIEIEKKPVKGIFRPMIRSRHPSHSLLRTQLERLPFRSIIRFGSTTELEDNVERVELNPVEAIKNSSSKLRMKQCFTKEKVKTAEWFVYNKLGNGNNFQKQFPGNNDDINSEGWEDFSEMMLEYPIVAKSYFGSKGKGNTLIKSQIELEEFKKSHNLENYIFENYCNYNKEYRLHVTKEGCFYSCRKMLKKEFKEDSNSWQRHDDNCVWILEENEAFDKPNNWDEIVEHCVRALKSCGLDFGACDLRVQNNVDQDGNKRGICNFIVVEINSAPSFGQVTLEKYKKELIKLLIKKKNG